MSLFAKNIPDRRGKLLECRRYPKLLVSRVDLRVAPAKLRDTREITLDVSHKDGYAALTKPLGETLQRDGFTRTGCARYHTVAIGHLWQEKEFC
jgi:hypothetical protein